MGCCGGSSHNHNDGQHANHDMENNLSPLELLKIRLARGEITFDEYEKIKAELGQGN